MLDWLSIDKISKSQGLVHSEEQDVDVMYLRLLRNTTLTLCGLQQNNIVHLSDCLLKPNTRSIAKVGGLCLVPKIRAFQGPTVWSLTCGIVPAETLLQLLNNSPALH